MLHKVWQKKTTEFGILRGRGLAGQGTNALSELSWMYLGYFADAHKMMTMGRCARCVEFDWLLCNFCEGNCSAAVQQVRSPLSAIKPPLHPLYPQILQVQPPLFRNRPRSDSFCPQPATISIRRSTMCRAVTTLNLSVVLWFINDKKILCTCYQFSQ